MHAVDDSIYYRMMNEYLWHQWRYIRRLNDDLLFKHRYVHLSMFVWENEAEEAFTRFDAKRRAARKG